MKKYVATLLVALVGLTVNAQSSFNGKLVPATQAVLNTVVTNPNVIIITGKLLNAATSNPITDANVKLSNVSKGLLNAAVDKNGNYALALDKELITASTGLTFKIEGYEDFSVKKIKRNQAYVDMDIRLLPDESKQPTVVKYVFNDDPDNTLVIKF